MTIMEIRLPTVTSDAVAVEKAVTKLVMHYAPGVLAVLKRHDCPGQKLGFGRGHSSCGCDNNHQIFTIAGVHLLQDGEASWCLARSFIHTHSARGEH